MKKAMYILISSAIILFVIFLLVRVNKSDSKKIKFKLVLGQEIKFSDFIVVYQGTAKQASVGSLSLGPVYNFKIRAGNTEQTVNWSAGAGDIGPSQFEVNGRKYWLEMLKTDSEKLANDEAVITEK